MIQGIESILIGSSDPGALAEFYAKVVGLKQTMEFEMGEKNEKGFAFEMKGCSLYIMHHSEVEGKNTSSARIMFNLETENIEAEVKKLDSGGARKIKDTYHMENYGFIATYADPDDNYFQIVQVRAPEMVN